MKPTDPAKPDGEPKAPEPQPPAGTEFLVREVVHGEKSRAWIDLSAKIVFYLRTRFGNSSFPPGIEFSDFVSDTMLKILTSIATFEYRGKDSFWKWVQTLAGNLWRDFWRRHERDRKLGLLGRGETPTGGEERAPSLTEGAASKGETPTQIVRFRELAKAEAECVAKLPKQMRDVYVMRRQHELSFAEISERTGVTNEATLRSHFMRARDKVRDCLGGKLDEIGTKIQGW
ncbi:MAG: sigma-70 family RNA polymerase sigma factor [Planctomycetes bacterium]|nr:sigma-70 family RNA polymerase sigma factor [Planctomycetota bacterium]